MKAAQEESSRRFHLSLQKSDAWDKGRRLAEYLERSLQPVNYAGPVVVAGGYMRDLAMGRTPKDLDVFLDGGCIKGMEHGKSIGSVIAGILGHGAEVGRAIPCYGTWAADVDSVVKIAFPADQDQELLYLAGIPVPFSVDLVILRRKEMVKAGYAPSVHLDQNTRDTFLYACLRRVDLRLNAIGSSAQTTRSADQWDADALNSRLVIQWERQQDAEDKAAARIDKRVIRLLADKYVGWTVHLEGPDGEISEKVAA